MRLITHRSRGSYWSSSRLSLYIRGKFGLTSPKYRTIEGWNEHEEFCNKTSPRIHWLTDNGFNKLQNIWLFIPDLFYTIRVAPLWKFFRTLWKFKRALWKYRSWDHSGLLYLMETAARDMSDCHKNHGHLMKAQDTAKELIIWAELLKRIREDSWAQDRLDFVQTGKKGLFGGWTHVQKPNTLPNYKHRKTFYAIERCVQKHQVELAAKMFERKVRSWWD